MKYTIQALLITSVMLVLSGCASSITKDDSPTQISVAPAIDVPYSDVIKNVPEHLGVKVRWGGQIIAAEEAENGARLTVLAYPLNANGLPEARRIESFVGGRFVVEIDDFDPENAARFLTVYGPISDKEVLTNGKFTKTIPVVTALEAKEWSEHEQRYAGRRYRLPYNGLGFSLRLGHGGYGYRGYGYGYSDYRYANFSPFFYPYRSFNSRRFSGRRYR